MSPQLPLYMPLARLVHNILGSSLSQLGKPRLKDKEYFPNIP